MIDRRSAIKFGSWTATRKGKISNHYREVGRVLLVYNLPQTHSQTVIKPSIKYTFAQYQCYNNVEDARSHLMKWKHEIVTTFVLWQIGAVI